MAKTRGARVAVAPNISRDAIGYSVQVSVGTPPNRQQLEKRFPFGTDFDEMKDWRDQARLQLRARVPPRPGDATLADDIATYLAKPIVSARTGATLESPETRESELAAWTPVFGTRRRETITDDELDACLKAWRAADVSASTCNHRRNALIQLWRALDGRKAPNPAMLTAHFQESSGEPREIPQAALEALIAAMPPSKTRALYALFAETGWPPARIRRIKPEHVHWNVPGVYLEDRRKGRGTAGRVFPMSARALQCMREFDQAKAYGGVSRATLLIVFRRALTKVNAARATKRLPPLSADIRPYDARHTIGAQVYRKTGDIYGTAELLGCSVETALRYTRAAIPDRMRAAAAAIDTVRGKPTLTKKKKRPSTTKRTRRHTQP